MKNIILRTLRELLSNLIMMFTIIIDITNPLFYSCKKRLKKRLEGQVNFDSELTAIFVLYQKQDIPFYVRNTLNLFKELGVNCIINVNEDIDEESINFLQQNCSKLLVRQNFGLDFAAYKDSILESDLSKTNRLILLNDSFFVYQKGIKKLFDQFINTTNDIVAFSENISSPCWHIQSFFLSFSKKVIQDPDFINFWKDYKPFCNKQYVISNGEVALSLKVLKKYYSNTKVIFNIDSIVTQFPDLAKTQMSLISQHMLSHYLKKYSTHDTILASSSEVLNFIENTNITHSAAFLLYDCAKSFILKRDIHYRNSFTINEIYKNLVSLKIDKSEIESTINELKLRGTISHLSTLNRFYAFIGLK